MAKISINLLPPEVVAEQLKRTKFYKIQSAGIAIILLMTFLTSLTVAFRILQSRNIVAAQSKLDESSKQVSAYKSTEASLFILKNRLTVIDQYLGVPSEQSAIYRLIDKLIPSSVAVNSLTINKTGDVIVLSSVPDSVALDNLVNNLTSKESNEGKISQVSIDSLNRGRDGMYRVSLKLKVQ